jgi:hypothetical protein
MADEVQQELPARMSPGKTYGGRPRTDFSSLPKRAIGLREHIRLISQRLHDPKLPTKYFLALSHQLAELRDQLKRHPRMPNGSGVHRELLRKEAREKKAFAASEESNAQQ